MPTAKAFFATIVKPAAEQFLRDPRDRSCGLLAAITLFHMADYWNEQQNIPTQHSLSSLRESLVRQCPDFAIIRDVADASKHHRLSRPSRQLTSSEQITKAEGLFQAAFGESAFNEASIVMFTLDDGTTRPLADVVRSVVSMRETIV